MSDRIRRAAVLGAGVMGSAIAAHLASQGIRTLLLDMLPPNLDEKDRSNTKSANTFALAALAKTLKSKPAAFLDQRAARLISTGNFEDDLHRLNQCDLVIEAVVEDIEIKKNLFEKVSKHVAPHAIIASNTSGLSVKAMSDALPESLRERFLVMHFFNPVRYMKLLELVAGPHTHDDVIKKVAHLGTYLGKGVVYAKDTPNFVANRIGTHGMMLAMHLMPEAELKIEEVDAILGVAMGRPKSAAFKTADVVGLDTLAHVAKNCFDNLSDDEERDVFEMPAWILEMIDNKLMGRKSGSGFYKKDGKDILVYDVASKTYREREKVRFDSVGVGKKIEQVGERIKMQVLADDRAGHYAWRVTSRSLCYAARRVGEIADDIVNIDRAMRWGFNWQLGPFETWDALGVAETVKRMQDDKLDVPTWVIEMLESGRSSFYLAEQDEIDYWDPGSRSPKKIATDPKHLSLSTRRKRGSPVIKENLGATIMDLGDGCLGFEVHTKMNTLDDDVVSLLAQAVEEAETRFRALVIANDGDHFGAGANIMLIYLAAQENKWDAINQRIDALQKTLQTVYYSSVPVVAAPFSLTLGGGAEVAMAASARQAHAETYMGLVEVGVGLVPAGGGCLRMVRNFTDDAACVPGAPILPFIGAASLNIAMAKVSTGAPDAKSLRYLLPSDGITLDRSHLIQDAKTRALAMADSGYRPPMPTAIKAAGLDASRTIAQQAWGMRESGYASEHDLHIAKKVAYILCGGSVAEGTLLDEERFLDLEREAFISLCGEAKTQERIAYMLMNNKALRN
jgi:3-hydroxyacyl-CoA dehydrogenase